ncbi:MAG: ankyrin repeat domain-containing protein, partial [Akkermansia sp.]
AVRNNRYRAARLLLQYGADVNRPTPDGQTPLMTAALAGDVTMVKLLLKNGADPAAHTPEGDTAADFSTVPEISTLLKHP